MKRAMVVLALVATSNQVSDLPATPAPSDTQYSDGAR